MTEQRPPVDCETVLEHLYELLDQELTQEVEQDIRHHLHHCERCFPLFEFEHTFHRFIEANARAQTAPPALRRRIFDQIFEIEDPSDTSSGTIA